MESGDCEHGLSGPNRSLPLRLVPAIIAVGSDALFNFFTKIPAGLLHLRKGTVRRSVVLALGLGSAPGSIAGVAYLSHLRTLYGAGVNDFIKSAVGFLLIVIPTLLLFQIRIEERLANRSPTMKSFAGMAGRVWRGRGGRAGDIAQNTSRIHRPRNL